MLYRLRNMPHTATKHVSCVAFKTFLDMVHELLQKFLAGIHFLLFKTTLQRGGTCEAHGIGAKMAPNRKTLVLTCPLDPLKLKVFKQWPLGEPRARFWGPSASILEPLGLDFEGPRLRF